MHKFNVVLLFVVLLSQAAIAQGILSGNIIDVETSQPIPYVNIGIVELMKGTVSDDEGSFSLTYNSRDDVISFSAIGYEPIKISVQELLDRKSVTLTPVRYELEEITVQEKALGKLKNLGYNLKKRGQSVGFGSTQLGTEIGGLIIIDRETIIYSAHFTFNHVNADSLLFRVNIYEMKDGQPLRNLVPENVLIAAPDQPGTISVNLSPYNIVTDQNVLLSLEWVKAVTLEKNEIQGVSLRANRTMRKPNAWFRSTSLAPFVKMDQFVKYNLGFYVQARQVKK